MCGTLFGSGQQGTTQGARPKTELLVVHLHSAKVRKFMKENNIDVGQNRIQILKNDKLCCCACSQKLHRQDNEESNSLPRGWGMRAL